MERLTTNRNRDRLLDAATRLIDAPSPTGQAGKACDRLAEILEADGFTVERPDGGHPDAPAVVARYDSGRPGKTLQFNGHLDTVHLPFVPARVEDGLLRGSGASDMKGGVAAALEALRMLRDSKALTAGSILFTAHDLHEAPWGDGRQLDTLIRGGIVGDAVLIPEPLSEVMPTDGRGSSTWKVRISRPGPSVHEVMRPRDEPSVIAVGAELIARINRRAAKLAEDVHPVCGEASLFIGQVHSGEIYNQYPQEFRIEGTRRWLPGTDGKATETEFRSLLADLASETGTRIDCEWRFIRDGFHLDQDDPFVSIFQESYEQVSHRRLPPGGKPFVDDGNSFWALGGVPAITHGPRAGGQHTISEWADIADMERVALLYALTAAVYCGSATDRTEDEEWPQPAPYPI